MPAILWATELEGQRRSDNEDDGQPARRIVISTHTISLQEQLITKDLPLLNSVIPREFAAVLVKGRRNYLSLRRLKIARERAMSILHTDEEHRQLREIVPGPRTRTTAR